VHNHTQQQQQQQQQINGDLKLLGKVGALYRIASYRVACIINQS